MSINSDFEKECLATLKNYLDTINGLASGDLSFCVDCGEIFKTADGCDCSGDPLCCVEGLGGWASYEALDYEYIIDYSGNYRSCEVLLACGGPDVTIRTKYKEISLIWGNVRLSLPLSDEAAEEIDNYFEEPLSTEKRIK